MASEFYVTVEGTKTGTFSEESLQVAHETGPLEKILLTFQKIEVENKDGKTAAVDEWRGR